LATDCRVTDRHLLDKGKQIPRNDGGGLNLILIETNDRPDGSRDAALIDKLIDKVLLKNW
jgi:hypothetical protein